MTPRHQFAAELLECRRHLAATITQVSAVDTSGTAVGAVRSGDLLFVADLERGLEVYNVALPAAPLFVAGFQTSSPCNAVQVDGNLAYLGLTGGLQILDVSNLRNIHQVGAFTTAAAIKDLRILDNKAYLAASTSGLTILDVSHPAAPVFLSNLNRVANQITLAGNFAYLAGGTRGAAVVDVSRPANPLLITTLLNGFNVVDVANSNNTLFVATSANGLDIYSIATPANPQLLTVLQSPNREALVSLSTVGPTLFLGTNNAVFALNTLAPASPVVEASFTFSGAVLADVSYLDGLILASTGQQGFRLLHANATNATIIGGTLTINGTDAGDVVTLSLNRAANAVVTLNGFLARYNPADFQRVSIAMLKGPDLVTVNNGLSPATIGGGQGRDTLIAGDSNDSINGGDGNDSILGGAGADTINAGAGNDTVFGNQGPDSIIGGDGDDSLNGSKGFDVIQSGNGNDILNGGEGNDTLYSQTGFDTITGGAGNDLAFSNGVNASVFNMIDGLVDTIHARLGLDILNLDPIDVVISF